MGPNLLTFGTLQWRCSRICSTDCLIKGFLHGARFGRMVEGVRGGIEDRRIEAISLAPGQGLINQYGQSVTFELLLHLERSHAILAIPSSTILHNSKPRVGVFPVFMKPVYPKQHETYNQKALLKALLRPFRPQTPNSSSSRLF